MLAIYDGDVYNNDSIWVDIIISDLITGINYLVLLDDDNDAYVEETLLDVSFYPIVDEVTSITYKLFIYNGQVFIIPISFPNGESIYANGCLSSVGNTVLLNIDKNSDVITSIDDVVVKLYDLSLYVYINTDIVIEEVTPNNFRAKFIVPIAGDFLIVVKVLNDIHLSHRLKVDNYSYYELLEKIKIIEDDVNSSTNDKAYI